MIHEKISFLLCTLYLFSFAWGFPTNLTPRSIQSPPANKLPGCEVDPSYAVGTSQYKDGDGVYMSSSCDNGLNTIFNKQYHCWTDYFLIGSKGHFDDWQQTGVNLDCAKTQSCNDAKSNLTSSCTTNTWNIEASIGGKILGAGVEVKTSFGSSTEVCAKITDTTTCTWTDQKCHSVWSATKSLTQYGYMRRSCNTPRAGVNVPNSAKRGDGYYTVGIQDFTFDVPTPTVVVGCAALCSDAKYPNPLPVSDAKMKPFGS